MTTCRSHIALALALFFLFDLPRPVAAQQTDAASTTVATTPMPTVRVLKFDFTGNTAFSSSELSATLATYLKKENLTDDDLEAARLAITQKYINAGYISSGADFPDNPYNPGTATLTYRIVESSLTSLRISGNQWLATDFLEPRIRAAAGTPLNAQRIKDQLEFLQLNPNIRKIDAALRPGVLPGEATLEVKVQDQAPFWAGLLFDNQRSPSAGAERLTLLASDRSLTGHADPLNIRYGLTSGGFDDMHYAGFDDFAIDYTFPITPADTTLGVSFSRSDDLVIESPFDQLNIKSRTDNYVLSLRHPLIESIATDHGTVIIDFALGAALAYRDNHSSLLGEPFSFGPGAENGRTRTTVLRLTQEYARRSRDQLLALRSNISIGLDAFGANTHGAAGVDSQFLAWQGQIQYLRTLGSARTLLIARASAQLTTDSLPSMEQFSIGGADSVRSYRENRVVRDNGAYASLELRQPLLIHGGQTVLDASLFADAGYAWSRHDSGQGISSLGVGLGFHPAPWVDLQIYYGYPFQKFNDPRQNLQDLGIHFTLLVHTF